MKLLNALVLAFFPFAASAQTFDTSTIPSGCRDNHFLPIQGSMPVQIIQPTTNDERGAAMLDPDRLATTGTEKGDRAVQSTQENQSVKSSTTSEDELTVNGPIEQGTPAQTEQAISEERDAAGSEKAGRIPAGAVQAADEPQTVKSSTGSYDP